MIAEDINLLSRVFLVGKMSKFFAAGWDSPISPGLPMKVSKGNGVIIMGHCFILRDLVPMSLFNLVMTV